MFSLRRYARRPSPPMVVALIALLLASGGVAYAAIPDSGGLIHGCYSDRTGTLRVINTEATPPETCNTTKETALFWNQTGQPGVAGADGATNVVVRAGLSIQASNGASAVATAECDAGERATGGGARVFADAALTTETDNGEVTLSHPTPASEGQTPTGWRARLANRTLVTDPPFAVYGQAYVICAAP